MTDPRRDQELVELAALYALEALGDDAQREFTRSLETASASTRKTWRRFRRGAGSGVQRPGHRTTGFSQSGSWQELRKNRRRPPRQQASPSSAARGGLAGIGTGSVDESVISRCGGGAYDHVVEIGSRWHLIGHRHPQVEEFYVLEEAVSAPVSFCRPGITIVRKQTRFIPSPQASRVAWPWS